MTNIAVQNTNTLVSLNNNQVITTSKIIAETFGKKHFNVLRDIEEILPKLSDEYRKLNFEVTFETVAMPNSASRQDKIYQLTKNGAVILIMGYTGEKAMKFKEAYINAFDKMEAMLSEQSVKRLETQQFLMIDLKGKYNGLKESFNNLRQEHNQLNDSLTQLILRGDHPLSPSQQQRLKKAIQKKAANFSDFHQYKIKVAFKYIWGKLYKAFDVPKYQLISSHQFDDALKLVQKLTKTQFIKDCPHAKRDYAKDDRQLDLFKHQVVVDMQESIELLKVTNDPAVKPIIINRIEKSIDKLNKLGFSKPQTITLK